MGSIIYPMQLGPASPGYLVWGKPLNSAFNTPTVQLLPIIPQEPYHYPPTYYNATNNDDDSSNGEPNNLPLPVYRNTVYDSDDSSSDDEPNLLVPSFPPTHHLEVCSPAVQHVTMGSPYNATCLAHRPSDWRADYTPPHTKCLPRIFSIGDRILSNHPYKIHPRIRYTSPATYPTSYDLRQGGMEAVQFLYVVGKPDDVEFLQLATFPPVDYLRLYHRHLPWHIEIRNSAPCGITIKDVLEQLHDQLMQPIRHDDYWNDVINSKERERISMSYDYRCNGDKPTMAKGIYRIDFLTSNIIFQGLSKGKAEMLEIRTGDAAKS